MTSYLVAIATDSHQSCVKMCLRDMPTATENAETQRQLVGTKGFPWAKVYKKSGRAPGHLLLPIQFQKRLNSLLLIFFWPISEEEQPGDTHVFLHEVVFLIERCSSVARSTGTFLRRFPWKVSDVVQRTRRNN